MGFFSSSGVSVWEFFMRLMAANSSSGSLALRFVAILNQLKALQSIIGRESVHSNVIGAIAGRRLEAVRKARRCMGSGRRRLGQRWGLAPEL